MGAPSCPCALYGDEVSHLTDFADEVLAEVKDSKPSDRYVVILDDHLCVQDAKISSTLTSSGFEIGLALRSQLRATNLEDRCLLVIRSANDDEADAYETNLHGFIPKSAISSSAFLNELKSSYLRRWGPS